MATCANCSSEALFSYSVSEYFAIQYCSRHVPKFLQTQRFAGVLDSLAVPEMVKPAKKAKKTSVVVEETPAEPTVVDDTPVVEEITPSEE